MKITCSYEAFSNAFQTAASLYHPRDIARGHMRLHLDANNDQCVMIARYPETILRVNVSDCNIVVPGSVLLALDDFKQALQYKGSGQLALETDDQYATIRVGAFCVRLGILNKDENDEVECPNIPQIPYHTVSTHDMRKALHRVNFVVTANDDTYTSLSYNLDQVRLEPGKGKLVVVAASPYRIAVQQILATVAEGVGAIGVPKRVVVALQKILKAENDDIHIGSNGDTIIYSSRFLLIASMKNTKFPNWKRCISKTIPRKCIKLLVDTFRDVVRCVAKAVPKNDPATNFSFDSNKALIKARAVDVSFEIEVTYNDTPVQVLLNPLLLVSFFDAATPAKFCTMFIPDHDKEPVCFVTNDGFMYATMPISGK